MSTPAKTFPVWAFFSLVVNGLLMLVVMFLIWKQQILTALLRATNSPQAVTLDLGPRHKLNYQQWVDVLKQEAQTAADKRPKNLTILAGDSLSLWFPVEFLPETRNWLNQAISGETSAGLLKRLKIFDRTQPEVIFVMIGINDLIRGVKDETILENQRQIMSYLRKAHPKVQIVILSILPHGAEEATWERKDKLLAIANSRIRQLNQQLQAIAAKEGVQYLDLHSLFTNKQGNLRREFTSDGLHLSPQGYIVWRTALQIYHQRKDENGR